MARGKATVVEEPEESNVDVSSIPEGMEFDGFDTVIEESATTIIFENPGESFIGEFRGSEDITPENGEPFSRWIFMRDGTLYAINKSYQLEDLASKVSPGQWVRITYVKDISTKRGLNDLKDMKVEVARTK